MPASSMYLSRQPSTFAYDRGRSKTPSAFPSSYAHLPHDDRQRIPPPPYRQEATYGRPSNIVRDRSPLRSPSPFLPPTLGGGRALPAASRATDAKYPLRSRAPSNAASSVTRTSSAPARYSQPDRSDVSTVPFPMTEIPHGPYDRPRPPSQTDMAYLQRPRGASTGRASFGGQPAAVQPPPYGGQRSRSISTSTPRRGRAYFKDEEVEITRPYRPVADSASMDLPSRPRQRARTNDNYPTTATTTTQVFSSGHHGRAPTRTSSVTSMTVGPTPPPTRPRPQQSSGVRAGGMVPPNPSTQSVVGSYTWRPRPSQRSSDPTASTPMQHRQSQATMPLRSAMKGGRARAASEAERQRVERMAFQELQRRSRTGSGLSMRGV